jgi:hypothetical protein
MRCMLFITHRPYYITLSIDLWFYKLIWSIIIRKPISMCGVKLSCSIIKTNLPHGRNHNNKVMKSHACRPWPACRLSQELSPVSHHLAHRINSRALSQLWTGVTRNVLLISDYIEQTTRVFIKSFGWIIFIHKFSNSTIDQLNWHYTTGHWLWTLPFSDNKVWI